MLCDKNYLIFKKTAKNCSCLTYLIHFDKNFNKIGVVSCV